MSSGDTTVNENAAELQHANLLSLFNNVPETNLSTSEFAADEPKSNVTQSTLGLKWEMGVAKLPGSDIQFRLDENGDVEVLTENSTEKLSGANVGINSNDATAQSSENSQVVKLNKELADSQPMNMMNIKKQSMPIRENGQLPPPAVPPNRHSAKGSKAKVKMNAIVTCEYCGKVGRRRTFLGRFCSKVCIAKHAVVARKQLRLNHAKTLKNNPKTAHGNGTCAPVHGLNAAKNFSLSSKAIAKNSTSRTSDSALARTSWKKRPLYEVMEETILDFHTFNWDSYLSDQDAFGLDCKRYELITGRSAYPSKINPFKEGCYLEAVDPLHQSLICLTFVSQVEGFRLRLHFEGYQDCYDFWADADSPLIFPCGFCRKTGRTLNVPVSSNLSENNDLKNAFSDSIYSNCTKFKIGDKLEAIDRKNHDLICVATIKDIIGDCILVHFDGWDEDYDYWANSSSPFIQPIGWCEANEKQLTSPPLLDPATPFVWSDYLKKTDSVAADNSCFKPKNLPFEKNTKIEVVDQRNPILVRVATIVDVTDVRIRVHFDGWSEIYDDWLDVDSTDIHPINWCHFARYPLHPPVNGKKILKKSCPINGCSALGHVNTSKHFRYHKKHYSEQGCPYSTKNLIKSDFMYNRFCSPASLRVSIDNGDRVNKQETYQGFSLKRSKKRRAFSSSIECIDKKQRLPLRQHSKRYKAFQYKESQQSSVPRVEYSQDDASSNTKAISLKDRAIHSSLLSSLAVLSAKHLPHCWDKNVKHLPGVDGVKASHVMKWDSTRVCEFIRTVTGKLEYGEAFEREEVDGEALLLLSQNDILSTLKLKLGPAVKIYNAVLLFKVLEKDFES